MIINSESSQSDWLAWTGVETAWACGFQALREEHVYGELRDGAIVSALTRDVHFGVVLGVDGTVTAAPLPGMSATHGEVRFHRLTPALKEVDFLNLSSYSAAIHDYYYAADAMRSSELRRDLAIATAGGEDIIADDVSYPGGAVGMGGVTNVRQGLDTLAVRGLAQLPDTAMAPGPAVDQYRVVYDHAAAKFVLAPQSGQSGAEIVNLINVELGGTGWQGGGGSGGGGEANTGSNVGTGGALGVYKAKSGIQLQFYGFRGGTGIVAQLNASTNSIDYSLDLVYADARYVRAAQLDDVAFTGQYAALAGLPTLGSLSAKNVIAFLDIVGTAIATLAEAQAGLAPDKLMTAQRVADAIAALAIPAARSVAAGRGLIGGGSLGANITVEMGIPSTVSGTSANSRTEDSHTHAINIGPADAMPTAIGQVGGYALMTNVSGATIGQGATVAGSSLRYMAFLSLGGTADYNTGSAGSGTWRCMGNACPNNYATLFLRAA